MGISFDRKVLRDPAIFTAIMTELASEMGSGRITTSLISVSEHSLQLEEQRIQLGILDRFRPQTFKLKH
jgi:hypothetical protein